MIGQVFAVNVKGAPARRVRAGGYATVTVTFS